MHPGDEDYCVQNTSMAPDPSPLLPPLPSSTESSEYSHVSLGVAIDHDFCIPSSPIIRSSNSIFVTTDWEEGMGPNTALASSTGFPSLMAKVGNHNGPGDQNIGTEFFFAVAARHQY